MCRSSRTWSDPQVLQGWDVGGAIDHELAIIIDPGLEPRQRLRRRAFDLLAGAFEFAAVTRAGDDAKIFVPGGETAEVGAYRVEREEAFLGANQVDARLDIHGYRVHSKVVGLTHVDDRRR